MHLDPTLVTVTIEDAHRRAGDRRRRAAPPARQRDGARWTRALRAAGGLPARVVTRGRRRRALVL
jgi:hypothetical protein